MTKKLFNMVETQLSLWEPKYLSIGDEGEKLPFGVELDDQPLIEIRDPAAAAAFRNGSIDENEELDSVVYTYDVADLRKDNFKIMLSISSNSAVRVERDRSLIFDPHMTYHLDIKRPKLVFSISWDNIDAIAYHYFIRGDWEQELLFKLREQD